MESAMPGSKYRWKHHLEKFLARHSENRKRGLCVQCGSKLDVKHRLDGYVRSPGCRVSREEKRKEKRREKKPPPVAPFFGLSGRRREFAKWYAETGSAEQSALATGYGRESAKRGGRAAVVRGHRLLKDPVVARAVKEVRKANAER